MQWSAGNSVPTIDICELPSFRIGNRRRAVDMSRRASAAAVAILASSAGTAAHGTPQSFEPTRVEASLEDYTMTRAVQPRLADLRAFALDDEVEYSDVGESRLLDFLETYEISQRPQITLRDDGSLRALWKGNSGTEISVKFGGNATLEIAVTIPREGRVAGNWAGYDDEAGLIDVLCGLDVNDTILG